MIFTRDGAIWITSDSIRMILGAGRRDIFRLVLRQGMAMILWGAGAGAVSALLFTRFLASLLFEVRATDAAAFGGAIAVLIGVALAACFLPACRAARADPMAALRWE